MSAWDWKGNEEFREIPFEEFREIPFQKLLSLRVYRVGQEDKLVVMWHRMGRHWSRNREWQTCIEGHSSGYTQNTRQTSLWDSHMGSGIESLNMLGVFCHIRRPSLRVWICSNFFWCPMGNSTGCYWIYSNISSF